MPALAWLRVNGRSRGALHAVLEVGQYAGLDQSLIERFVDTVQPLHHVPVEEHIKDGLDPQGKGAGFQGSTEGQRYGLRAEGIVVVAQLAPAVEHRQALVEGEQ